jgi:4-hydroxy-tetrahydrodipicolinate reductase
MKAAMRVLLVGAKGRMGQAISVAASEDAGIVISAICDRGDALEPAMDNCDVVVDFSQADATADVCRICVEHKKPIAIGTTGHSAEQTTTIKKAAASIPIVLAPNFSVGVNVLFWLTRKAAELLGSDYDLEIIEMHHRMKKDAPSGTAKRLAEILSEARAVDPASHLRHGREGMVGERPPAEIGIHAVRGGDVVGDHRVIFASRGERLELAHQASSRETFASGALRAAQWVVGKPPALYSMGDVLGL